jgi:hypothetical protein
MRPHQKLTRFQKRATVQLLKHHCSSNHPTHIMASLPVHARCPRRKDQNAHEHPGVHVSLFREVAGATVFGSLQVSLRNGGTRIKTKIIRMRPPPSHPEQIAEQALSSFDCLEYTSNELSLLYLN